MSIPGFQTIMLPLLEFAKDGEEHSKKEAIEFLSHQFALSENDLKQTLRSGSLTFANRVAWCLTYLKKALLLTAPHRGSFKITARGLEALAMRPSEINVKFLDQYTEFRLFRGTESAEEPQGLPAIHKEEPVTPEEIIENAFNTINGRLADEILESVKKCSPAFLESLVVTLIVSMGYGGSRQEAGMAIGASGDEGIDGIINEDKLGLDVIYLQAKRWEDTKVGRPEIQKFVGALTGKRAKKGIFITTSEFSKEAEEYARNIELKVILIDGVRLANLMIEHNVGVTTSSNYEVKKIDGDFFLE